MMACNYRCKSGRLVYLQVKMLWYYSYHNKNLKTCCKKNKPTWYGNMWTILGLADPKTTSWYQSLFPLYHLVRSQCMSYVQLTFTKYQPKVYQQLQTLLVVWITKHLYLIYKHHYLPTSCSFQSYNFPHTYSQVHTNLCFYHALRIIQVLIFKKNGENVIVVTSNL